MEQPIKVRITESFPDPNWKNDPNQHVIINGASTEPTDNLIQYRLNVYGAASYITSLYFNDLGDAYKAWVKLREETTINENNYLTEFNGHIQSIHSCKHTYDNAVDFVETLEKFNHI